MPYRLKVAGSEPCTGFQMSTDMVGIPEAYDFWCDTVFYNFNAARKPEKEFSATVKGIVDADPVHANRGVARRFLGTVAG